jgi:cytochrome c
METEMKGLLVIVAAAAALAAGTANAASHAEQLKAKGCLGCHDVDKKKVGPALKDVAAKYKGDKGAEAALVAKLKDGKGHPKINASEDELKKLVGGVLATK